MGEQGPAEVKQVKQVELTSRKIKIVDL